MTQLAPGQRVTVTGRCVPPGLTIEIWLFSTPIRLGTTQADATGAYSLTVTIPASVPAGAHHIAVLSSGSATVLTATNNAPLTVVAPRATNALVRTGAGVLRIASVAVALVAVGWVLRSRRRSVESPNGPF